LWQTDGGALAVWQMYGNQIEAANDLKVGQTSVAGNLRLCLRRNWRWVVDSAISGLSESPRQTPLVT
jgi:hypothetical protein